MLKKIIHLLLFFLLSLPALRASHIVGGEIRYTCLGYDAAGASGTYFIEMRVYRDCHNGVPFFDNPAFIGIYNSDQILINTVPVEYQSVDSVSLADNDPCRLAPNGLCVDVAYYSTTVTLPYSPSGYYFVYQRCCRNEILNNITSPAATGATFYVFMSGAAQLACNSSPSWSDYPPVVICLGKPLDFDHSASDVENDQITYSFCTPLAGGDSLMPLPNPPPPPPYVPVNYTGSYTALQPMGGNPPVDIDPATGIIAGVPDHLGHFAVAVCGQEFRNGELMSEFRRDVQFIVSSCNQTEMVFSLNPGFPCDQPLPGFDLKVANGTPPYSYLWSTGDTTYYLLLITPGQPYSVTVSDAGGCTATATLQGQDCVWPGDANYDGLANNEDILAIGLFYGDNGPLRPFASTEWKAQFGPYWSDYQLNGVNTKHADCDGSGSIDVFDSHVVNANYGQPAHPTAFHPPFQADAPLLSVDVDRPAFMPDSLVTATVLLGSVDMPAQDVYGIAFTITCDPPEAVKLTTPLLADWSGSAFGSDVHTVSVAHLTTDAGGQDATRIDAAICSTRRLSFPSLSGLVGHFGLYLAETAPAVPVTFSLTNVRLINAKGEEQPVNAGSDVLGLSGATEPAGGAAELGIVPNPAGQAVTLRSATSFTGNVVVELYDAEGRLVLNRRFENVNAGAISLDLPESVSPGAYRIRVCEQKRVLTGSLIRM